MGKSDLQLHLRTLESLLRGLIQRVEDESNNTDRSDKDLLIPQATADLISAFRNGLLPHAYVHLGDPERRSVNWMLQGHVPQATQFSIDLLPHLFNILSHWKEQRPIRIVDIGSGAASFGNLLSNLSLTANSMPIHYTAIDLDSRYRPFVRSAFRNVRFLDFNIFDYDLVEYDVVVCSHVIEHFEDPFPFIDRLRSIAGKQVLLYAPYLERERIPGHYFTFDDPAIHRLSAKSVQIVKSRAWKTVHHPDAECFIAVLDGHNDRVNEHWAQSKAIRKLQLDGIDYEAESLDFLSRYPDSAESNFIRGSRLITKHQAAESYYYFKKAQILGADEYWTNRWLSFAALAKGLEDEAIEAIRKCISYNLDTAWCQNHPLIERALPGYFENDTRSISQSGK